MGDGPWLLNQVSKKFGEFVFDELLTFYRSNSVTVGLAKLLTCDLVTKDHPSLNPRRAGVGGPWNP